MTQLRKDGFTFKRFFIAHDKSPMKVTTDSALLGAWTPINHNTKSVLDIGCGCGIIALMLAQRLEHNDCRIDAIDIDQNAIEQCAENIKHSPFNHVYANCVDVNDYKLDEQNCYDLIVSNPPYFESAVDCRNQQRQQARYTENLNHQQLLNIVKRLLNSNGRFCLVLPYHLAEQFKHLSTQNGFYLQQETNIRYRVGSAYSLTLLSFSLIPVTIPLVDELCMRKQDNYYTDEFNRLLKDFYLFRKKERAPNDANPVR